MNAPIESPTNPDFPPAANDLLVESFNGFPVNYRWALRVGNATIGYRQLITGNGLLTNEQWAAWTTQPDTYVLECAARNLGITLA